MSVGVSQNFPSYDKMETNVLIGRGISMLVKKSYKFRLYPNKKQMELMDKTIGCSRFVFNFFLGKQKEKDTYWHVCEEIQIRNSKITSCTKEAVLFFEGSG